MSDEHKPGSNLEPTQPSGNGRARGLVSAPSTDACINVRTYGAAEDLSDVVAGLWRVRWDLREAGPHTTELLGDPCVHFVFERGASRVVGVWTDLWTRTLEDTGHIRAVKLHAGAMRAFIDTPASELSNCIQPLGEVLPGDIEAIEAEVMGPSEDDAGFARLGAWLRNVRLRATDPKVTLARDLVRRIDRDPELTSVEALAEIGGVGVRALQRLFRDYVGASPKWVVRRRRLQDVAVRIERGEAANLSALAADLGYADGAHMARDFKAATGKPPTGFAELLGREP